MRFLLCLLVFGFGTMACAAGVLRDGKTLLVVDPREMVARAQPGSVVLLGEAHDSAAHHENQREVLRLLGERAARVSVGLEFFERPYQQQVDLWTAGQLAEAEFLKQIGWGKDSFDFYREQALFPITHGGKTLALNAPRALTSQISKKGIEGLTEEERKQLPPDFTVGSATYRERFSEMMEGHVPASAMARYFEAHSTWDDTMAFVASEYLKSAPEQILVILVGDFHAAYRDGLAARLRARGVENVMVVSQVLAGMDYEPHPTWGERGDYVWIAE